MLEEKFTTGGVGDDSKGVEKSIPTEEMRQHIKELVDFFVDESPNLFSDSLTQELYGVQNDSELACKIISQKNGVEVFSKNIDKFTLPLQARVAIMLIQLNHS